MIALVALGRLRYKLSLRDLPEMFAVRGMVFSYEAVRDMLERWLARAHARLRRLPVPPCDDGRCPGQRTQAFRRGRTEIAAGADSRARWLAAYEDVRRRHLAGEALLAISRATGLARATVRKYA